MKALVCVKNDVGKFKENNEDTLLVDSLIFNNDCDQILETNVNIACVLDGIGGDNYGELASEFGAAFLSKHKDEVSSYSKEKILNLINETNTYCKVELSKLEQSRFSGTTLAGVIFHKDCNCISVFNVGDSRVYLVTDKFELVSYDDSLSNYLYEKGYIKDEDREKFPYQKNMIFNAIGNFKFDKEKIHYSYINLDLFKNFRYVFICSDGISDYVKKEKLTKFFRSNNLKKSFAKFNKYLAKLSIKDNYSYILIKKI